MRLDHLLSREREREQGERTIVHFMNDYAPDKRETLSRSMEGSAEETRVKKDLKRKAEQNFSPVSF